MFRRMWDSLQSYIASRWARIQKRGKGAQTAWRNALSLFDHGPGEEDEGYEMHPYPVRQDQIAVFRPESIASARPGFPTEPDYLITVLVNPVNGEVDFTCTCRFWRYEQTLTGRGWCKHTEGLTLQLARFTPIVEVIQDRRCAVLTGRENAYAIARNVPNGGATRA